MFLSTSIFQLFDNVHRMKSQHLPELIVFVSFLIRLSCSDSSYVTPRLKPHLWVQDITINDLALEL